jgi:hypothetical protein
MPLRAKISTADAAFWNGSEFPPILTVLHGFLGIIFPGFPLSPERIEALRRRFRTMNAHT